MVGPPSNQEKKQEKKSFPKKDRPNCIKHANEHAMPMSSPGDSLSMGIAIAHYC